MNQPSAELPRLKLRQVDGELKTIVLLTDVFTIGRSGENDLKIQDSHISRMHAEIVKDGAGYKIIDRKSKSGTYVNGERIVSRELHDGDQIYLGQKTHEITFVATASTKASYQDLSLFVTTSFATKDSQGDLQHVARFLEGVRRFSAGVPHQDVLDMVLDMAVEISGADRAFLILLDTNKTPLYRSGRDRNQHSLGADQFQISRSILQQVLEQGSRVVMTQDSHPETLSELKSAVSLELRKIVCLPLHEVSATGERQLLGALYMDSKQTSKGLSNISEGLLESLARDASVVLVNIKLLKEARERESLELELGRAREIQEHLLPTIDGSYGYFEACAENRPSRRISGDYFDLIPLSGERFAMVIADISGKGIPAALLASLVQGALFIEMSRNDHPMTCLENMNRYLFHRSDANRFVSLFLAVLDAQGQMNFVNAGHNPPYLVRASGEIEELSARGIVLGIIEEAKFEQKTVTLGPGDVVCLYTDGVTEAQNSSGEFFGEDRLRASLQNSPRDTAGSVLESVLESVLKHTGDAPRNDDLTLLTIRRL